MTMTNYLTYKSQGELDKTRTLKTHPDSSIMLIDWKDNIDLYLTELLEYTEGTIIVNDPFVTVDQSYMTKVKLESRPQAYVGCRDLDFLNITSTGTITVENIEAFIKFLVAKGDLPLGEYHINIDL